MRTQNFAEPRIIFRQAAQIHLPEKFSVRVAAKVFQQKAPQVQRRDFRRQRVLNFSPRLKRIQIQRQQRIKNMVVRGRVGARCHVHHDQFFHARWKIQRELHRHLAAHRVADDVRAFDFLRHKKFLHVGGHERIIHLRVMRRMAMVAQVRNEDVEFFCEPRRDAKPVVRRAEQPMQQHERFAVAELFEVKLHYSKVGQRCRAAGRAAARPYQFIPRRASGTRR